MKFLLKIFALSVAILLMGGCSSSSDGDSDGSVTGYFVDDPVAGLTYECSSGTDGVTDLEGKYTCENGDNVSFSIGNIPIGTIIAQAGIITPYSFFPNNHEAALNLARLLQSLDTDTSDDIITLDPALVALLDVNTDFESPTFVADAESDLGIPLVTAQEAQTQLNDAIIVAGGDIPDGANIPVANAGIDQNVNNGDTVTLDGSASGDADGDLITYAWSIVSKPITSTATLSSTTVVNPTFTADESGSYVVELVVNDGSINSAPDEVTITATLGNATPVADAGIDQNVITTNIVSLDGSASSDADIADVLTYSWTITSKPTGSIAVLSDATIINPTFEADLDGTYEIQLVVNDGIVDSVSNSVTVIATTANIAPVADAGPDQYLATTSTVTLDGSGSSDANFDGLTYSWSVTKPDSSTFSLTGVNPTFTADISGVYTASLLVYDGTVNSDSADSALITAVVVDAVLAHNGFSYGAVVSPYTGRIWLDRNLGASQVCTAYNDTLCYGDYYQWGRGTDGHEIEGASTTDTQVTDINNAGNAFVIGNLNTDWVESAYDNYVFTSIDLDGSIRAANWSKTDGTSVCPVGYRVPTRAEIAIEIPNNTSTNQIAVFEDFLKFPSVGYRYYATGVVTNPGQIGVVWSSTAKDHDEGYLLNFVASDTTSDTYAYRGRGASVRCIKDY